MMSSSLDRWNIKSLQNVQQAAQYKAPEEVEPGMRHSQVLSIQVLTKTEGIAVKHQPLRGKREEEEQQRRLD